MGRVLPKQTGVKPMKTRENATTFEHMNAEANGISSIGTVG